MAQSATTIVLFDAPIDIILAIEEPLQVGSCVLLTDPINLENVLAFQQNKIFQAHIVPSLLRPTLSHFIKDPYFL